MLDVKPGPATEAARRAAGWPTSTAAPAIESELRAAEAEASEPYEPAPLPEWPATVADDAGASEPELEPRRGFFARLFGRRRKALPSASPPEPLFEDAAADEPEPLDRGAGPAAPPGDGRRRRGHGARDRRTLRSLKRPLSRRFRRSPRRHAGIEEVSPVAEAHAIEEVSPVAEAPAGEEVSPVAEAPAGEDPPAAVATTMPVSQPS